MFEIAKTASGYASIPTTLVNFNGSNGGFPYAVIADARGNLFGTTRNGGAYGGGTVFEIAKTASGYASTPSILFSFCPQASCTYNGTAPLSILLADANGNLFGTTFDDAVHGYGTVFELTDTGFVPPAHFYGTPGSPNCHGQSVADLTQRYGGMAYAAPALGYASVQALQDAVKAYCGN